jgi:hypothetical protein
MKEEFMELSTPTPKKDKTKLLSTVWIFVVFNYLYCDLIGMMDNTFLKQYLTGTVGNMKITQGFLLGASILMEIPIAMILLSKVLKYKANRWANIIAGTIMTLAQVASLTVSTPTIYYAFFSIIEITTTLYIVWAAWKWTEPQE